MTGALRLYLAAQLVTTVGSAVTAVVLPVLAFQLTGSATVTAVVAALEVIPYLVLGPLAGALADRLDRRRLMIAAGLAAGAVVACVPVVRLLAPGQPLPVMLVLAVGASASSAWVFEDAAHFAALPVIAGPERLVAATSLLTSGQAVAAAVAPAAAGLMIAAVGAPLTLLVDVGTYGVAALLVARVRAPFRVPGGPVPGAQASAGWPWHRELVDDVRVAARWLREQPVVRGLTLIGAVNAAAAGAITAGVVVLGVRVLGVGPDSPAVGLLYAAVSTGAVVGSAVLPWLRRRGAPLTVSVAGLALSAAALGGLAAARSVPAACLAYALWGVGNQVTIVNGITYRQSLIPDLLQGRVNVLARMVALSGTPVGALIGGVLSDRSGPVVTVLLAVALLALALAGAVRLRRAAAPEAAHLEPET